MLATQKAMICDRIAERMDEVGWVAIDLAAAIRTAEKTVYRWLKAEYAPRSEYLVSICRVLEVSPLWLLGVADDQRAGLAELAAGLASEPEDADAPTEGGGVERV